MSGRGHFGSAFAAIIAFELSLRQVKASELTIQPLISSMLTNSVIPASPFIDIVYKKR